MKTKTLIIVDILAGYTRGCPFSCPVTASTAIDSVIGGSSILEATQTMH